MRIFALDTSTNFGSMALLDGTMVVDQQTLPQDQRSARSFAPAMDELLARVAWSPKSIQLVATTNGPGSFTGLRIAVTVAKTLAYAVHADLIALNTLDVLVKQLPDDMNSACVIMDAQRRQFFAATYLRSPDGQWRKTSDCQIVDHDELLGQLTDGTTLTGPASCRITEPLPDGVRLAEPSCWTPNAMTVGALAWERYNAGERADPLSLAPQYYRPSYAEEKARKNREKNN